MGMKRHASEEEEELSDSEGGFLEDDELDSENQLRVENDDQQNGVHKEDEMEELEREYSNLRSQEEYLLRNLMRDKDDDIRKGQAVKNQKALWDRMLEIRILLQKTFSSSNKLPQVMATRDSMASKKENTRDEVLLTIFPALASSSPL